MTIVQQPSGANNYTTKILLDDDRAYYADYYEFRLSYQTTTLPQPQPVGSVGGTGDIVSLGADPGDRQAGSASSGVAWGAMAAAAAVGLAGIAAGGWYARRRLR